MKKKAISRFVNTFRTVLVLLGFPEVFFEKENMYMCTKKMYIHHKNLRSKKLNITISWVRKNRFCQKWQLNTFDYFFLIFLLFMTKKRNVHLF